MPRDIVKINNELLNISGLPVVFHKRSNALILADIHLGYEDHMASLGVFLPRLQLRMAIETVKESLKSLNQPVKLVIAGDLKHVFEKLTRQERIESIKFIETIEKFDLIKEIILVKGNHDTFITPLLKKLGVEIIDDHLELGGNLCVIHGHKETKCDLGTLVMGHEHAAILVDVGGARTKLPVLLEMPLADGRTAYILPPTGIYQTGNNISLNRSSYLSPIVKNKGIIEEAIVWIVDRDYGTVKLAELKYVVEAALF